MFINKLSLILSSLLLNSVVYSQNSLNSITLSLTSFNPNNPDTQTFSVYTKLNHEITTKIEIINVLNHGINFFVIQAHSFLENVIFSYTPQFPKRSTVSGKNVGLVQISGLNDTFSFYLRNFDSNSVNNSVYIVVIPYGTAPIPGGCNLEFETEIAPYQKLRYNDMLITIDAEAASMPGHFCERQVVKHDIYRLYLTETDLSESTYFEYLNRMITVQNITYYGTQVSSITIGSLRKFYSAYKGVGSVYVLIANFKGYGSAYVPIVSYACDIKSNDTCQGPVTVFSRILCSILVFLGLFICYYGHRFFKTEMFLVGLLFGSYLTFLLISEFSELTERDSLIVSLLVGCVFGGLWFSFWWFCGIPILSTLLSLLTLGFLIASIIFYSQLSDLVIMHNDITFWGFFTSIVLMTVIILTGFVQIANMLSCAIVGSFAIILAIDHYCGANLKYIFINIVRRVTVPNFNSAVIRPPYQLNDLLLTLLWFALAASGLWYQRYQQKGRPPFPPARVPQQSVQQPPHERTPLLAPVNRVILIQSNAANA